MMSLLVATVSYRYRTQDGCTLVDGGWEGQGGGSPHRGSGGLVSGHEVEVVVVWTLRVSSLCPFVVGESLSPFPYRPSGVGV